MIWHILHPLPLFLIILSITCPCHGQAEPPPSPPTVLTAPKVEFTPVSVRPAADGESYMGTFRFINHGKKPLKIQTNELPVQNKITPAYPAFEISRNDRWLDLKVGYSGLSLEEVPLNPEIPYEFEVFLDRFREQATPLTGRVSLHLLDASGESLNVRSAPFVLDWTTDRAAGKFTEARKANFAKARRAFARSGFREDKIAGDDFCQRLLREMMDEAASPEHPEMIPFEGDLDVTPAIEDRGRLRIDFASKPSAQFHESYRGWFYLNPEKCSPRWLRQARENLVTARGWGKGFQMTLDRDNAFSENSGLFLDIKYTPEPIPDGLIEKRAQAAFIRMLDVLLEWCPENEALPPK